jgi:hypothetical protein
MFGIDLLLAFGSAVVVSLVLCVIRPMPRQIW